MNQSTRIHIQQDKNEAFFGVGDVVKGKCLNGYQFNGEIICIDIRKQDNKLHPAMDLRESDRQNSVWIENISELEIVQFKGK